MNFTPEPIEGFGPRKRLGFKKPIEQIGPFRCAERQNLPTLQRALGLSQNGNRERHLQRCPSWVGVASRMLNDEAVGVIVRNVRPARRSSSRYPRSIRSRLPVKTSIVVSKRVASDPAVPCGTTTSTSKTLPASAIAVRQFVRILIAASSSQSWTIHFNR